MFICQFCVYRLTSQYSEPLTSLANVFCMYYSYIFAFYLSMYLLCSAI